MNLPAISGIEATRRLRRMPGLAALPVIDVSAQARWAYIQECRAAGMDEVVAKPLMPDALAEAVYRRCGQGVAPTARETLTDLWAVVTQDLVQLMLERLGPDVAGIIDDLERGEPEEVDRRAHQLKGAIGNLDLPELVEILANLSRRAVLTLSRAAEALPAAAPVAERALTRSLRALEDQVGVRTAAQ